MKFVKKMQKLCDEATQGKWKTEADGAGVFAGSMLDKSDPVTLSISMFHKNACNDGLFIAAHNPEVMALVWSVVEASYRYTKPETQIMEATAMTAYADMEDALAALKGRVENEV